jgi:hypothetical protein
MQHTTAVAVVATQLAGTDRRTLSQAWYSALHLAERAPAGRHAPLAPAAATTSHGPRVARPNHQLPLRANAGAVATAAPRNAPARYAGDSAPCACERRAPRTELARRIERGLTRRPPHAAAASFAVRGPGGRVHLVVRTDGARTRVVAVCAPPLRERVERALAQARFALAGRGVRAEVA